MHCSRPLLLTFEGPEQGFGGKNCQNGSREKCGGKGGRLGYLDPEGIFLNFLYKYSSIPTI